MSAWTYKISTLRGAPRALGDRSRQQSRTAIDLDAPRVSIYCAHEGHGEHPWLFGSFEPNVEWYEQTGEVRWGWSATYPTADGYEIRLTVRDPRQSLLGNVPLTPPLDPTLIYDAELRARHAFKCGDCGMSRTWVDDSVQKACAYLLTVEHREADLQFFDRVVKTANR